MNFLVPLPCFLLAASMHAQMEQLKPEGGGRLTIGARSYQLEVSDLRSARAKPGLPGAIHLGGRLIPPDGSQPFQLALTLLKDGSIYLLRIERRPAQGYPDTWAAGRTTRTRVLRLEDRPGGRLELQCEGRLTGVLGKVPQEAVWAGRLWAQFPGGG